MQQPRSMPLTVLIVDDHPLMRSALREALCASAQGSEILQAADPEQGLALLASRPDVDLVILDLNFSKHDGLDFIRRYRRAAAAAPLVVCTIHEDAATLKQAIALGAAGVIPKTHSQRLLQKAIELVMEGGIYLPPVLAHALPEPGAPTLKKPTDAMTQQQLRILELLVDGAPTKEIARRLGIASSTVKNQLTAIFQRLGVANRTQAAIAGRALLEKKTPRR